MGKKRLELEMKLQAKIARILGDFNTFESEKNKYKVTKKWLLPLIYHIAGKWFDLSPLADSRLDYEYGKFRANFDSYLLLTELLIRGAPWSFIFGTTCQLLRVISPYTIQKTIFMIFLRSCKPGSQDIRNIFNWYSLSKIEKLNELKNVKEFKLHTIGTIMAAIGNMLKIPIMIYKYLVDDSAYEFDTRSFEIVKKQLKSLNYLEYLTNKKTIKHIPNILDYHYVYFKINMLIWQILDYFELLEGLEYLVVVKKGTDHSEYILDRMFWPHSPTIDLLKDFKSHANNTGI